MVWTVFLILIYFCICLYCSTWINTGCSNGPMVVKYYRIKFNTCIQTKTFKCHQIWSHLVYIESGILFWVKFGFCYQRSITTVCRMAFLMWTNWYDMVLLAQFGSFFPLETRYVLIVLIRQYFDDIVAYQFYYWRRM